MAENTKSLLDGSRADAFAEGAARMEQLIQTAKTNQVEVRPIPAVPHNPLLAVSPDEEWSRKFQSVSIGPEVGGIKISQLAPVPQVSIMPEYHPLRAGVPKREAGGAVSSPASTIGAGRGKPERPRRSWLGRLLQRS